MVAVAFDRLHRLPKGGQEVPDLTRVKSGKKRKGIVGGGGGTRTIAL